MLGELLKRWLYVRVVQSTRALMGIKVHYRVQYGHDYMSSPRWYLLRSMRLMVDGYRCTHRINRRRCGARTRLQMHHTNYRHKGAPGLSGFLAELSDLRSLCDKHHSKDT